jgi:hypothetical protein
MHTSYADLGGYGEALHAAHGAARAREVLAFAPQNVVFYPSMALKGAPQVMRVLRPLAADRTVLEAWAFQPVGAPTNCCTARCSTTGRSSRRCRSWRTTTCTCSKASSAAWRRVAIRGSACTAGPRATTRTRRAS